MTFGFPCWSTKSPGIKFGSSSVPGLNVDVGTVVVEKFDGFTVVESVQVNLCQKLLHIFALTNPQ